MIINGGFWANQFNRTYIPKIEAFRRCLVEKVLPSFDNIETEAEAIANAEYEKLINMPADGYSNEEQLADKANNKGIDYFTSMEDMKRDTINLFTAGLYHYFIERQLFEFYRSEILTLEDARAIKKGNVSLLHWAELTKRFKNKGVDLESLSSYREIDTLKLVSNTIKHGEGNSAKELRERKPDYFRRDIALLGLGESLITPIAPRQPLTGEDLIIPLDDFIGYCECCKTFWEELGDKICQAVV